MSTVPTPADLAATLAPKVQALLSAREPALLAAVPGPIGKAAFKLAFPELVKAQPVILADVIGLVSREIGAMNVDDLLAFLSRQLAAQADGGP